MPRLYKEEDLVTRMKKTVIEAPQKGDREVALVRDGGLLKDIMR